MFRQARTIFDANNAENLPGTRVLGENDPPSADVAVQEVHDGLGSVLSLFTDAFGRNSINNGARPIRATVHFGKDYDNAFWDGVGVILGDGDGETFNRFTTSVDVIGHELAHGVTQNEAGLVYWGQPGALNESISDVFGSLAKQFGRKQSADQADWLMGEGLFTQNVQGTALRSMKAPGTAYDDPHLGKDPQPASMREYVRTLSDNGGVHINSGIPNRAFYLVATRIGGNAWEKAGQIWYSTLRSPFLRHVVRFREFALVTTRVARWLYGTGSEPYEAVISAWSDVGIDLTSYRVRRVYSAARWMSQRAPAAEVISADRDPAARGDGTAHHIDSNQRPERSRRPRPSP